jgi:hypothetical protein
MTISFNTQDNVGYNDDNTNGTLDAGESFWGEPPAITTTFTKE